MLEKLEEHPFEQVIPPFIWVGLFKENFTSLQLRLLSLSKSEIIKILSKHKTLLTWEERLSTLYTAIKSNKSFTFDEIIDLGRKIKFSDADFFYLAISLEDLNLLKFCIERFPGVFDLSQPYMRFLAHWTTPFNKIEIIKFLLEQSPPDVIKRIISIDKLFLLTAHYTGNSEVLKYLGGLYKNIYKPRKNLLTVLTTLPSTCFGDISAAGKLISILKEKMPALKINWIICSQATDIGVKDIIPANINVRIVKYWKEIFTDQIMPSLANSTKVICFPTFHYLQEEVVHALCAITKVVVISEYDYMHCKMSTYPEVEFHIAGFGKNALGIFNTPVPQFSELSKNYVPAPIRRLFKESCPNTLNNRVFFGYCSLEPCYTNGIDSSYFILICMGLITDRNIAIITRLPKNFDWLLDLVHTLEPDTLLEIWSKNSAVKHYPSHLMKEYKRKIIICDPFPISQAEMAQLLFYSNIFCMATGDQSMSEALSFAKLPLYQCMSWKQVFFNLVMNRACEIGEELPQFFILQEQTKGLLEFSKIMVNFVTKNYQKLKEQGQKFSELINRRYNLGNNLSEIFAKEFAPANKTGFFKQGPKHKEIEAPSSDAKKLKI